MGRGRVRSVASRAHGITEMNHLKALMDVNVAHQAALREAEDRFQAERDRRYTEVSIEREKALKIKEVADLTALSLAREIQTYKDEKANELRSQIERERGSYATKDDLASAIKEVVATIKPALDYMATQQGRTTGLDNGWKFLLGAATLALGIWLAFH